MHKGKIWYCLLCKLLKCFYNKGFFCIIKKIINILIFNSDQFICCCAIGDSGGPIIIADIRDGSLDSGDPRLDQLVGIISFGDNYDEQMSGASAHIQITKFLPWIYKALPVDSCLVKVFFGNTVLYIYFS